MLTVVAYHAGLGVTGGYVGVDVFFVISGFLITSLIMKELETGTFSAAKFWERRARRILPALTVTVIATLVAGWVIMLPADYHDLGTSAAWQSVFAANFYFWRTTGYFGGVAEQKPLLHTWSLAVEEQFYMLVPLLLLALYRVQRFRERKNLALLFVVSALLSLAVACVGVSRTPAAAFFLLPSRAWELLAGAIIAVAPVPPPASKAAREIIAAAGTVAIVMVSFMYTKTTPFPGFAALPPVLGTAGFIWASGRTSSSIELPIVARVLATRPIVFIGLISYSLYLWHWPILALTGYATLDPVSWMGRAILVIASFAAAVVSWRFVETPFRERRVCKERSKMFSAAALGIAAVLVFGIAIQQSGGIPSRFSPTEVRMANARTDTAGIHELTPDDIRAGRLIPLGVRDGSRPIALVLWGDSHGMAAAPAFDEFLRTHRLAGMQATASATAPVIEGYWQNEFTKPATVKEFNNSVLRYIADHHVPIVVLAGFWEYYTDNRSSVRLDSALLATTRRLRELGAQPYVLVQVPHPGFDVPKALVLSKRFGYELDSRLPKVTAWNGVRGDSSDFLTSLEAAGARIINARPDFLDSTKQHFMVESRGFSLYRDDHHLSTAGAKLMLVPVLEATLGPLMRAAEPPHADSTKS